MRARLGEFVLAIASTIVMVFAVEAAFRMWHGVSPFVVRDFRNARIDAVDEPGMVEYDPVLGWRHKANLKHGSLNTIEHGIRRSSPAQTEARTGAVLAVGSSFTAGSEVLEHEAWPAQLEQMLGQPVLNAAVGGYALDQIVLRAEQLIPVLRPSVLLVPIMTLSIRWSGRPTIGRPKPYFTIENGQLVAHNSPVPRVETKTDFAGRVTGLLGYSLVVDRVLAKTHPEWWYREVAITTDNIENDELGVSCLLLKRLKEQTERAGIRTFLVAQYAGPEAAESDQPPFSVAFVVECARKMGFQMVDTFAHFRRAHFTGELRNRYTRRRDNPALWGHFSVEGNRAVAEVIASKFHEPPAEGRAADYVPERELSGDGNNLLTDSEALGAWFGNNGRVRFKQLAEVPYEPRQFRLEVPAGEGERHVSSRAIRLAPGSYSLSMELRPEHGERVRVQLTDGRQHAMIADFDLGKGTVRSTVSSDVRRFPAGIRSVGNGWYRVWTGASVPGGDMYIVVELMREEGAKPDAGSVLLRSFQLERGHKPSPYRRTLPLASSAVPPDQPNLAPSADRLAALSTSPIITLSAEGSGTGRTFRMASAGPHGEHYFMLSAIDTSAAAYLLSLKAKSAGTARVRVQLLGAGGAGAIGDFDLEQLTASLAKSGDMEADATIAGVDKDWRQIRLAARLAKGPATLVIQLLDNNGNASFAPNGEAFLFQAVRLERINAPARVTN
jgi:hypothetical protein